MFLFNALLSSGRLGYSFIRFRVQTSWLCHFTFSFVELTSSMISEMISQPFFQSCIVFVVRERVTVCNLKTDSKSEFGRPRYGLKNRGSARGDSLGREATWAGRWCGRGPHGLEEPLPPCGPCAPHGQGVTWPHMIGRFWPSLSSYSSLSLSLSPFEKLRRKFQFSRKKFLSSF